MYYQNYHFLLLQANIIESEIDIDPKHHKHLAARRAQTLKDVSDEFGGVTISLPKDHASSKVTIKGLSLNESL